MVKLRRVCSFTVCTDGTVRAGGVLVDDGAVSTMSCGAEAPPLLSLDAKWDPSPVGDEDVTLRLTTPLPVTTDVIVMLYQTFVVTGPREKNTVGLAAGALFHVALVSAQLAGAVWKSPPLSDESTWKSRRVAPVTDPEIWTLNFRRMSFTGLLSTVISVDVP